MPRRPLVAPGVASIAGANATYPNSTTNNGSTRALFLILKRSPTSGSRCIQGHNLKSRVYIDHVSGDAAAQVAGEKDGHVPHFGDVCIPAQRRVLLHELEDLGEVLDAARGDGFDGAGGNRIDANLARPQLAREVA